jgi:hypothetical protein
MDRTCSSRNTLGPRVTGDERYGDAHAARRRCLRSGRRKALLSARLWLGFGGG